MLRSHLFPVVLVFVVGSSGIGQDGPSGHPSPPSQAAPRVKPPAAQPPAAQRAEEKPAAAKQPDARPPLRQEHIIYLPFKNLGDVFEHEDSSIVLPYAQFLEMWNRLVQPDPQPVKPPVNGLIARADYTGSVKGELVYLDATLDVEVLSAEWAQLPVQFGDAAIGSAQSEDGAVLLRGVGEGKYELLVRGRGKHQIKLSLVVGVKAGPEGRSCTVQCPGRGSQQPGTGDT